LPQVKLLELSMPQEKLAVLVEARASELLLRSGCLRHLSPTPIAIQLATEAQASTQLT
jgi:hypothetical protein